MGERLELFAKQPKEKTSFKEKVLLVSQRTDEVQIVAGALIAIANPLVGGAIIGPSVVTRFIAKDERRKARDERITKELQKAA